MALCGLRATQLWKMLASPTSRRLALNDYYRHSRASSINQPTIRPFHATLCRRDIMEFFEDKHSWGLKEIRSGRAWTLDELRIKSNEDLHKLWFLLYKEKNMLLTTKEECERVVELFPNPERIDKVEESMERLQQVIGERDRAVKLVEIGITGEPPVKECYGFTGRRYRYHYTEHLMPYWRNPNHFKRRYVQDKAVGFMRNFLLLSHEKNRKKRYGQRAKETAILHRASEEYPDHPIWQDVDIQDLRLSQVYHTHPMSD